MKRRAAFVTLMLGLPLLAGPAGARPEFSTDAGVRLMFGNSTYKISVCEYIPDYSLTACAESELEFPLDVWLADFNLGIDGTIAGHTSWRTGIEIATNISDPGGKMKDCDLISVPDWGLSQTFSYSESNSEADVLLIDLSGQIAFLRRPRLRLEAVFGYMYEDLSYEVFGIEGWQLDPESGERVYFSLYQGVNVLDYDLTYNVPYLGVSMRGLPSPSVIIDTRLLYSPIATAEDRDDHILRMKTAESDCEGSAFMGSIELTWLPRRFAGGTTWAFGLGFDLTHVSTDGDQTQRWYGDDPADPTIDETGLVIDGIDTEITGSHRSIFFRAGVAF